VLNPIQIPTNGWFAMTATLDRPQADDLAARQGCDVDIVIPVYNEQEGLLNSVGRLYAFLASSFPFTWRITIADNASTDRTWVIAQELVAVLPNVVAVHLDAKGRGRALNQVWSGSDARVVAYMDVDLSTDLGALLPLVAPLLTGHSDVAIGSRLARSSRVVRGPKREFISRSYNFLIRATMHARFSDAQCGFKAMRTECARRLLPLVQDTGWFFDTELLLLAERAGLRIAEVPVDWIDDPDSRVDIRSTAMADLRALARMGRAFAKGTLPMSELRQQLGRDPLPVTAAPATLTRQAVRFGAIGVASTLAYLVLFLLLHGPVGAQAANFLALVTTALANTAANRRFTFGLRGRQGAAKHQLEGLVVFAIGLVLTSGSLALLTLASSSPPRVVELGVLIGANLAATIVRFVLLRHWVFRDKQEILISANSIGSAS
jgi:putative flippase GtrA